MGNSQEPQMVERVTDLVSTSFSFMFANLNQFAESGDYKHPYKSIIMKRIEILGLSVAMIVTMSVAALAGGTSTNSHHHESENVEVCSQGKGACRHAGCGCQWYNRANGGAGKCVCGHWDYVHN